MQVGGHFLTKILRKQFKKLHQYKFFEYLKIHAVQIAIILKILWYLQKN